MVRFKNRYFLVQIILDENEIVDGLSMYTLLQTILDSIAEMYGEYGLILGSGVQVKYYSPYTGMAIIRASRHFHKAIWIALTFIRQLKGRRCVVHVVHLSGTIKLIQKAAIEYDQREIDKIKANGCITEAKAKALHESSTSFLQSITT